MSGLKTPKNMQLGTFDNKDVWGYGYALTFICALSVLHHLRMYKNISNFLQLLLVAVKLSSDLE